MLINSVGIVVRTKDRPQFLKRALDSISRQTFTAYKVVVVNDGGESVDSLVSEQLKDKDFLLFNNEKSLGMEAASNQGVQSLDTEYVVLLDDDDTWSDDYLKNCVQFLEKAENVNFVGVATHSQFIFETWEPMQGFQTIDSRHHTPELRALKIQDFLYINPIFVNSLMYRRSVFLEIGGYREDLPVVGDWEFNLRLIVKGDIGIIPRPLANYHQRLTDSDKVTGNTVVRDRSLHQVMDANIRNDFFRRMLEKNPEFLGFGLQNAYSYHAILTKLESVEAELLYIRSTLRKLIYPIFALKKFLVRIRKLFSSNPVGSR